MLLQMHCSSTSIVLLILSGLSVRQGCKWPQSLLKIFPTYPLQGGLCTAGWSVHRRP